MEKNCATCEYQNLSDSKQPCHNCCKYNHWTLPAIIRQERINIVKTQLFDEYCKALCGNEGIDEVYFEESTRAFHGLLNFLEIVIKGED